MAADNIFNINSDEEFNQLALEVFKKQYEAIPIYKKYADLLKKTPESVTYYLEIPFLPIDFFKNFRLNTEYKHEIVFKSSGTGGIRSQHFVADLELYKKSFLMTFNQKYGNPKNYNFLALLPSYLENGDSSLVYMVQGLMEESQQDFDGFYLDDMTGLKSKIEELKNKDKMLFLFGVSYALLDFCEIYPMNLLGHIVLETGGMKGRKKEMTKQELHTILKKGFGVDFIHSEYGMTELLSQAYLNSNNQFTPPAWMKVLVRDVTDPFTYLKPNQTGVLNVIDLANINSISFIATSDLGKSNKNHFEVLGRLDYSDIRGCNLLYV